MTSKAPIPAEEVVNPPSDGKQAWNLLLLAVFATVVDGRASFTPPHEMNRRYVGAQTLCPAAAPELGPRLADLAVWRQIAGCVLFFQT